MVQSYNPNCCFRVVLLFQIYIYSNKFSFEILAVSFLKIWCYIVYSIYRQSDCWDIKFSAYFLKIYACYVNMFYQYEYQSFVHDKSSSTWQSIKSKSKDLQKLVRYLSEIVTSKFKLGAGAHSGQLVFPSFPPFRYCFWFSCYFCLTHKWFTIWSIIITIIHLISIIILQTSKLSLWSNTLYMGITMSRSSALFMNVLLIFDLNGALFLNTTPFYAISLSPVTPRSIVPFTTIYTSP